MPLTTAQTAALKAAILGEADPTFAALRAQGATGAMAEWFNEPATPLHSVWRTEAPVSGILDAIAWDAYTPTPVPDGTALYTNRALVIQTKQMNLQNMLIGRDRLDCSKARIRAGLQDAVTNLPSGNNGNAISAGGVDGARVLGACTRPATRGEKIFTAAPVATGSVSAGLLVYEGRFSDADVVLAVNS